MIELDGLRQTLWPVHCVQGTVGAQFAAGLNQEKITRVFRKGEDVLVDSYSGFFDNGHRRSTGLGDFLGQRGVSRVYIMGLATEYCVKFTALDAVALGFEVFLVEDGCRGVELSAGDVTGALEAMRQAGARIISSGVIFGNGL